MTDPADILICACAQGETLPGGRVDALLGALRERGIGATLVPDLCALAARRDCVLHTWAHRPGARIVACRPRAVRCLFEAAGAALDGDVRLVDLREDDADAALRKLGLDAAGGDAASGTAPDAGARVPAPAPSPAPADWYAWFPAIDRERCNQCGQCVEFCLFGVYEIRDGRAVVVRPENCKPNCPACARICPRAAIIFPKHGEAPIDGSAVGSDEDERARARRDLHAMLGDDPLAALAERKRRREQIRMVDPERLRRAMEERRRCATPQPAAPENGSA